MHERLFQDLLVYLDDILAYASTAAGLAAAIRNFLELIDRYGLKLQPKKCTLFEKALVWVGHHVSAEGVSVNPEFVRTLLGIPSPTTEV